MVCVGHAHKKLLALLSPQGRRLERAKRSTVGQNDRRRLQPLRPF